MTLPELREAEAPAGIAAIYAALRAASGVSQVNLIWRHLATLPGVLPWAWEATRPALESGAVAAARARLLRDAALPAGLCPVDAGAWQAAGLAPAARDPVLAVIDTYNRGNATNLILLTALRRAITGAAARPDTGLPPPAAAPVIPAGSGPGNAPDDTQDNAPLAPIPALPRLEALPPETAARVRRLAARHAGAAAAGIVPSLYLHLANWPALLAALPGWLAPVLEGLDDARAAAIAQASVEAAALAPLLRPGDAVPGGHGPAVAAVLARFTTAVIPDMVPIGLALRSVLAPAG